MPTSSKIQDQTFLFTGTLTEFTRDEAEALVEANGGKVLSGVTAKLNYLVVGEDAGSKLEKAKKLGTVKILTEREFLKMVPKGKALANKPSTKKVIKPAALKKSVVKEKTKPTVSKASAKKVASETAIEEVKIGDQIWMAQNLDVAHFRNGDLIPEAKSAKEWLAAFKKRQPACCYYENSNEFGDTFGRIYNSFALDDKRGLAPLGWRLSTLEDWTQLRDVLGKDSAKKIKSSVGWEEDMNGSKKPLFNAQPGGMRCDDGSFGGKGYSVSWWCNGSVWFPGQLWIVNINNEEREATHSNPFEEEGFYVRCVKENNK
jgi:uncharacterized protein (TIGR02145 family)